MTKRTSIKKAVAMRLIKQAYSDQHFNWDSDWRNIAPAPSSDQSGWTVGNMMDKDYVFHQRLSPSSSFTEVSEGSSFNTISSGTQAGLLHRNRLYS